MSETESQTVTEERGDSADADSGVSQGGQDASRGVESSQEGPPSFDAQASLGKSDQSPGIGPLQSGSGQPVIGGIERIGNVAMTVAVELGRTTMAVKELLQLRVGSLVELDRAAGSPVDLLVNGKPIARGEVVVIDDDFGVRISEILPGEG
jgi:flagellar motor switch protein FliN/FliY